MILKWRVRFERHLKVALARSPAAGNRLPLPITDLSEVGTALKRYILCRKYLHAHISCANLSNQMDRPNDDLTGRRFGKLVVLPRDDFDSSDRHGEWLVQCECGRLRLVPGRDLLTGRSSSCGCTPARKNGHNGKTSVRGSALRTRLERVMNELPPHGTSPSVAG
jgi:hypothetical protein